MKPGGGPAREVALQLDGIYDAASDGQVLKKLLGGRVTGAGEFAQDRNSRLKYPT
jgi:hypothetical protein